MAKQETPKTAFVDSVAGVQQDYNNSGFHWGETDWAKKIGTKPAGRCLATGASADKEAGAIIER